MHCMACDALIEGAANPLAALCFTCRKEVMSMNMKLYKEFDDDQEYFEFVMRESGGFDFADAGFLQFVKSAGEGGTA